MLVLHLPLLVAERVARGHQTSVRELAPG
jgi:hypothetical protein